MSDPQLLQQLTDLLKASRSFKLYNAGQQQSLLNNFTNSTDEQLSAAIEAVKQSEIDMDELEKKRKEQEEKALESAQKLKESMKAVDREMLAEADKKDRVEAEKTAEKLLAELEKIPQIPVEKMKRKKLFGIF